MLAATSRVSFLIYPGLTVKCRHGMARVHLSWRRPNIKLSQRAFWHLNDFSSISKVSDKGHTNISEPNSQMEGLNYQGEGNVCSVASHVGVLTIIRSENYG